VKRTHAKPAVMIALDAVAAAGHQFHDFHLKHPCY
jgi:hypothetical protein